MKQIQFQNHRKAPHPFQQYGNMPPAAYKNRSLQQQYGALPQGQQAFVHKIGKKMFDQRHNSSIKQHWLGIENNDILSNELARYHHKVKGKSLQTKDIEGAQGGSMKPSAVRYKQKALELKNQGKINIFDRYNHEKQQYRHSIQKAIKSQHQNDKQIGKMISEKGHGHYLNPQNHSRLKSNQRHNNSMNSQNYLKEKYSGFDNKDKKYQQFFTNAKNDQETYEKFFSKLQSQPFSKQQRDRSYSSIQKPKNRHKQSYSNEKYNTIGQQQNYNLMNQKNFRKQYEIWRQKQMLRNYQPPNFSKKSIESQFRNQQGKGINLSPFKNENLLQNSSLNQSRLDESYLSESINTQKMIPKLTRKFNPTNLSNPLGSSQLRF